MTRYDEMVRQAVALAEAQRTGRKPAKTPTPVKPSQRAKGQKEADKNAKYLRKVLAKEEAKERAEAGRLEWQRIEEQATIQQAWTKLPHA